MSVMCSMQQCGLDPAVLRELEIGARAGLYSWYPANYTDTWGLTLLEELHNLYNSFSHSRHKAYIYTYKKKVGFAFKAHFLGVKWPHIKKLKIRDPP